MRKDDTAKTHQLRHECHELLEEVFGKPTNKHNRVTMYVWLKNNGIKEHMADMTDVELEYLRFKLIMMDEPKK